MPPPTIHEPQPQMYQEPQWHYDQPPPSPSVPSCGPGKHWRANTEPPAPPISTGSECGRLAREVGLGVFEHAPRYQAAYAALEATNHSSGSCSGLGIGSKPDNSRQPSPRGGLAAAMARMALKGSGSAAAEPTTEMEHQVTSVDEDNAGLRDLAEAASSEEAVESEADARRSSKTGDKAQSETPIEEDPFGDENKAEPEKDEDDESASIGSSESSDGWNDSEDEGEKGMGGKVKMEKGRKRKPKVVSKADAED